MQMSKQLHAEAGQPSHAVARRSIILDRINPRDFRELNLIYACEQCSFYDSKKNSCAMGFPVEYHLRENQLKRYNLTGKMAICRAQEID